MLATARQMAAEIVLKTKPGRRDALYDLLAQCMNVVELCQKHEPSRHELHGLFLQQDHEGNRRYVEKGSDEYVLVCRYVFNHTDRTNAMRYACALRVAGEMGLSYSELVPWMKANGGVNSLYFRRPLEAKIVRTRNLYLTHSIEVPRDREFNIKLQWRNDNSFEVIGIVYAKEG